MVVTVHALVLETEADGSVGPGSFNCFFGGVRQVAVFQAAKKKGGRKCKKVSKVFCSAPRRCRKIRKQNVRTSTVLELLQRFAGSNTFCDLDPRCFGDLAVAGQAAIKKEG